MPTRTDYFLTDKYEVSSDVLLNRGESGDILDYIVCFLAKSVPPENFAVKGQYAISKMVPDSYRQVFDIDIITKSESTIVKFHNVLRKLGASLISAGIISKFTLKDTDSGFRDGMVTYNDDGTPFINIEVCTEDLTTGIVWANIAGQDVQMVGPERCIADKLISTWSDRRSRRAADFYDIYHMIRNMSLNVEEVANALDLKDFTVGRVVAFTEQELFEIQKTFKRLKFRYTNNRPLKLPQFSDVCIVYGEFCLTFCEYWKANKLSQLEWWDPDELGWHKTMQNPLATNMLWGTITGASSLAFNGLTHYGNIPVTLLATKPEMDGAVFGPFTFVHISWENEDSNFRTSPHPNWRIPTPEKAISDYMLALDILDDEELLVEAISDFIRANSAEDVERLKGYCSNHGNSAYKITQYFADAQSMLEF